ncbi:MAG: transglycosylase family protein [Acidimicrobiia bacterium]
MLVPTRATIVAVIALLALPLVGGPARAADADGEQSIAALRSQADAIAGRYFDALARYATLDREITANRKVVAALAAGARRARADARDRAVSAYRTSSAQLSSIVDSHDSLAAARRVRLIDHVNERDQAIYSRLRATTKALSMRRRALEADRKAQADALDSLHEQSTAMEAKLALAQQQQQQQQEQEQARLAAQTIAAPATTAAPPDSTLPTTTAPPPKVVTPAPPPNYQGTPGVHPKHVDPFLTCVRTRESGGNYRAVNPAGPYLGAYQFLQATWNGAANHAGRTNLVGVPANLATPYDQDDVAWALYQWQGAGPWGGACP